MRHGASIRLRFSTAIAQVVACLALLCLALAASAESTATSTTAKGDKAPCKNPPQVCLPRTDDEIWVVSTRGLGCPDCDASPALGILRHDCDACRWNPSSLDEFLAEADPAKPTVFWVHGNRLDAGYVRSQGLSIYRQLTRGVSGEFPIRFVIFSWPTDPTRGIAEDARRKAARTNIDGYYLGWLVSQIDPNVPINFIGHSFGARIVTGALHLLGGGVLAGRSLPEPVEARAPMQAVLLAAAVNNTWLAIGRPHGQALEAVDRMLAMNNHCDMALKRYPKIDRCNRPQALGYTGAYGPLGENGAKLWQIDVCCTIGKSHGWESYFYTLSLVARMRPYLGLTPR